MAMTAQADATGRPATTGRDWYSRSPQEVAEAQLVTGDVVLVTAGDQVPADGRIVTASALLTAMPAQRRPAR
jgi:P-type Ca2+ transporter type 2C